MSSSKVKVKTSRRGAEKDGGRHYCTTVGVTFLFLWARLIIQHRVAKTGARIYRGNHTQGNCLLPRLVFSQALRRASRQGHISDKYIPPHWQPRRSRHFLQVGKSHGNRAVFSSRLHFHRANISRMYVHLVDHTKNNRCNNSQICRPHDTPKLCRSGFAKMRAPVKKRNT